MGTCESLKERLGEIVAGRDLGEEKIEVRATVLTPEEAIGRPGEDDYPILKGKERMMAARFRGAEGHAFTDMAGNFDGSVSDVLALDLSDNFRRAVFVSTLNAITRSFGIAERTRHCRDEGPRDCAAGLVEYLRSIGDFGKAALVGLQPRMLEALTGAYEVRAVDMDPDNLGMKKSGVIVEGEAAAGEVLDWCDMALVTGTTVVNGTIDQFLDLNKPTVFYGVSIAGTAALLGLRRYCPGGR